MITLFRHLRRGELGQTRIINYILYALGELILVIMGILMAVQINNWNEDRKARAELHGILEVMMKDLASDTLVAYEVIRQYDLVEPYYNLIIDGEMTREIYDTCRACFGLITGYIPITVNSKGYQMLKAYNGSSSDKLDSLTIDLIRFYESYREVSEEMTEFVAEDAKETIRVWRDKYPWFKDWSERNFTDEVIEYMTNSWEYRNRVVFHQIATSGNLVPMMKTFKVQSRGLIKRIADTLEDENTAP